MRHQPEFIDYQGNLWPSLDLQLLRAYLDAPLNMLRVNRELVEGIQVGQYTIPTDKYGRYMLNFNARGGAYSSVSMIDVMEGRVAPGILKDKIVLIGPEAVGLGDIQPTPFDPMMPEVELHAIPVGPVVERRRIHGPALKDPDDRAGDQRPTGEDGRDANREQHHPETDPPARRLERWMRRFRGEIRSHHSQNSHHPVLTRSRPSHGTSPPVVD